MALVLIAWSLLALALVRLAGRLSTPASRTAVGTVLVLLTFLHAYGLGDYPDSVVRYAMMWMAGIGVAAAKMCAPPAQGQGL